MSTPKQSLKLSEFIEFLQHNYEQHGEGTVHVHGDHPMAITYHKVKEQNAICSQTVMFCDQDLSEDNVRKIQQDGQSLVGNYLAAVQRGN